MAVDSAIPLKVVFSVLVTSNLFGNTLVILVVFMNRSMQTPMNFLLANLALADLMFGIFIIPLRLLNQEFRHPRGWLGDFLCKTLTYGNLAWMGSVASVMTLIFIAWERYQAVIYPHNAQGGHLTKIKLRKMVIITWITSAIFLIPETWALNYNEEKQWCHYGFPGWLKRLDSLLWLALVGLLPLVILTILYGRIVGKLWCSRMEPGNVSQRTLLQTRKRVTRTVLMVTVILGCCWLPNLIYVLLDNFDIINNQGKGQPHSGIPGPLFYVVSHVFIITNTAINPVIYATQDRKFRHSTWRLVTLIFRRNRKVQERPQSGGLTPEPGEEMVLRRDDEETKIQLTPVRKVKQNNNHSAKSNPKKQ